MKRGKSYLALVLPIILTVIAALGVAFAVKNVRVASAEHVHCVCGGTRNGVGDHVCGEEITWTGVKTAAEITALNGINAAAVSGQNTTHYIYLENDITLSANIAMYTGANLYICLNGHTLTGPTSGRIIQLVNAKPGYLSICDCSPNETGALTCRGTYGSAEKTLQGQGVLVFNTGSRFDFYGGTIQNAHIMNQGGANVHLGNGTLMNMYGGHILNGQAEEITTDKNYGTGGNLAITGASTVMNMYGGEIGGGIAETSGGNVCVINGTFNMNGGEIKDGSAVFGANVSVLSSGKFYMNNGTISGGTATKGGAGVYTASTTGVFNMNGGLITGGNACYGGNIYALNWTMNGGTISKGVATRVGTAGGFGGNVSITTGTFTMNDGLITEGLAVGSNGGNICLHKAGGKFIMNGGTVSKGVADGRADRGGIAQFYEATKDGGIELNGGTVTENEGGVYAETGTIWVSQNPTVTGNIGANITSTVDIIVKAPLTGGMLSLNAFMADKVVKADADYSAFITNDTPGYYTYYDEVEGLHGFTTVAHTHTAGTDHCICGGFYGSEHTCTQATWTAWTSSTELPTEAGNYYLTKNVNLGESQPTVSENIAICLNGFSISGSKQISVTGTLTFSDCSQSTVNKVYNAGLTVLIGATSVNDTLFKASGAGTIKTYDAIHTNSLRETRIDLINDSDNANRVIDIYIIAGQSNAAGTSLITSAEQGQHDYNIYQNVYYYESYLLTNGTRNTDWRDFQNVREGMGYTQNHIGPELGMASALNELYTSSDKKALIIKVAAGGTSILMHQDDDGNLIGSYGTDTTDRFHTRGSWYPECLQSEAVKALGPNRSTGFLTRRFIEQVGDAYQALLDAGYRSENINFVSLNWMQGETDRLSVNAYGETLPLVFDEMKAGITARTGEDVSNLRVVIGEISITFGGATKDKIEQCRLFIEKQNEIADTYPNACTTPSRYFALRKMVDGVEVVVGSDQSHFVYADMLKLGEFFAKRSLGIEITDAPEAPEEENVEHTHCICGGNTEGNPDHTCEDVEWTPVTSQAEIVALDGVGEHYTGGGVIHHYIYLANNITLTSKLFVGSNVDLHICLNGFTLYGPQNDRTMTTIDSTNNVTNTVITFCDCSEKKTGRVEARGSVGSGTSTPQGGLICLYTGTTMNIYGGTFAKGTTNLNYGGNFFIGSGCTLNQYGGTIEDGSALKDVSAAQGAGGNVAVGANGSYNLYAGTVTGGYAGAYGGNIVVLSASSRFAMYGGLVTEGSARWGGNIGVPGTCTTPITISGGTVSNGTARTDYAGNIGLYSGSTLNITGDTTVIGGKALKGAGGNIALRNGDQPGTLNISGNAVIADGEAITTTPSSTSVMRGGGNIWIYNDAKLNITGGTIRGGKGYVGGNILYTGETTSETPVENIVITNALIENGTANANGCEIQNENKKNGVIVLGEGVIVNSTKKQSGGAINTASGSTLRIKGGTYNCFRIQATSGTIEVTDGYFDAEFTNYTNPYTIAISGGYFVKAPADDRLANNCIMKEVTNTVADKTYNYRIGLGVVIFAESRDYDTDWPVATVSGGGAYFIDEVATLSAPASTNGFAFVAWYDSDDNIVSYEPEFTINDVLAGSGTYRAIYIATKENSLVVTVLYHDTNVGGNVYQPNQKVTYSVGDEVTLSFSGETDGFVGWCNESGKLLASTETFTFRIYADMEIGPMIRNTSGSVSVLFVSDSDQLIKSLDVSGALTAADVPEVPFRFGTTGGAWSMTLTEINEAIQAALTGTKTPVVVKATGYTKVLEIYEPLGDDSNYAIEMTLTEVTATSDPDKFVLTFGATRHLAESLTLVEQGFIFTTQDKAPTLDALEATLFVGSKDCYRYISSGQNRDDITVLNIKNVPKDKAFAVLGYMTFYDPETGKTKTIYTELMYATSNGISTFY